MTTPDFSYMTPMLGEMVRAGTEALSAPEVAQRLATFSRNYYDALIARGFSELQAFELVSAHGAALFRTGK